VEFVHRRELKRTRHRISKRAVRLMGKEESEREKQGRYGKMD